MGKHEDVALFKYFGDGIYVGASYDACHKVGEGDITSNIFECINQQLVFLVSLYCIADVGSRSWYFKIMNSSDSNFTNSM